MKIPFTTAQFFEVIEKYNIAVFPVQFVFILLGIISLILLHSKRKTENSFTGGFLGILWIWTGIVYHLLYFTAINKAAYVFGGLFIVQGLFFLAETFFRKKLDFEFKGKLMDLIAYFFILFGLIIYSVLIYFLEGSVELTITLGLPCPTTIFTFGLLMLSRINLSKYLLIIPALWTVVGTSAAINFGVYPDYIMALAALTALVYLLGRKKVKNP